MTYNSDLHVEILDDKIIVTMPGTSFRAKYRKRKDTRWLIASDYMPYDPAASSERGEFLARARKAANDKTRELGWIE